MNHLTDITYTDEEILELSQTQTYLFEILVRKYEEPFLRKAQSILHDKEIATDVVQDTFVKIFLQAKSFTKREGAQFSSWAYKILINTSLTAYAKQKKNWRTEASLDAKLLAVLENTQHKDVFSLIFDKDEVLSYISKLPEIFQEVTKKILCSREVPQADIIRRTTLRKCCTHTPE